MKSPNKRLIVMMMAIALILCIPLIAMQFTNEVNWTLSDFVMMGILLLSTVLLVELVLRKVTKIQHRIILCALLIFGLFIVWAELAVGIFGSPFAGN